MRLTIVLEFKRDLSGSEIAKLDAELRKRIPELVGWSYSSLTGELTLDFGDAEDLSLLRRVEEWVAKAEGRKRRFEIIGVEKEWEE